MIRKQKLEFTRYYSPELDNLGIKHGFYTRACGVSKQPFDGLNVKYGIGDDDVSVTTNRDLIKNDLGVDKLHFAKLVHKDESQIITQRFQETEIDDTDALITYEKQTALGLSVSDCLPIIVSDGKLLAVIHAGWRGTVARITDKTIKQMIELGLEVENTVAAIGPCICKQHFEVDGQAAEALARLAGDDYIGGKYHADLARLNIKQLNANGINNIDSLNQCSLESSDWFSYRQSSGKTGRNMAAAVIL